VCCQKLLPRQVDTFSGQPGLFASGLPKSVGKNGNSNASERSDQSIEISEFADDPSNSVIGNIIGGLILAGAVSAFFTYINSGLEDVKLNKIVKRPKIKKNENRQKDTPSSDG
jgi:hypothetical protein